MPIRGVHVNLAYSPKGPRLPQRTLPGRPHPAYYRFSTDEVYIHRDPQSGVISLSEKPFRTSTEDLFRRLDEAGAASFTIERDLSFPPNRDIV